MQENALDFIGLEPGPFLDLQPNAVSTWPLRPTCQQEFG